MRPRPGETLNTTAPVHEAYLKLADSTESSWQDKAHFLAVVAQAMRPILVDDARKMKGDHRGGRVPHTLVNGSVIAGKDFPIDKE